MNLENDTQICNFQDATNCTSMERVKLHRHTAMSFFMSRVESLYTKFLKIADLCGHHGKEGVGWLFCHFQLPVKWYGDMQIMEWLYVVLFTKCSKTTRSL